MEQGNRVIVAMSGGVDSSVAAFILVDEGYDCAGATLKLFRGEENPDVEDARSVARELGIPFYMVDFAEGFDEWVVRRFVEAYQRGETPNPCVDCNRFVKFSALLRRAGELGYDSVATGHYVRRDYDAGSGRYILKKGLDASKDQSYVLYALTQDQLAKALFPLGDLSKAEVRAIAESRGFLNARKKDSQDICFVPGGDHGAFIEKYTGKLLAPGRFMSPSGQVLGAHRGTPRYTLGQRKGLGLALPEPGYVCAINPSQNTVTVGDESLLFSTDFDARDINLIACQRLDGAIKLMAKVRYRQPEQPCTVRQTGEDTLHVSFDSPQRAITPGQAVVLYDGDTVVGGGTISNCPRAG